MDEEPQNESPVETDPNAVSGEIVTEDELTQREDITFDVQTNAHIAAISYAYILSLVVLFLRRDSRFAQFHARQGAVLFFLAVIGFAFPWWLRIPIELALFLAMAYGFIQASQGNWYRMPVVIDLLERDPKSRTWQRMNRVFLWIKGLADHVLKRGEKKEE